MVIYRPHRHLLKESMQEAKEFNNIDEMLDHIINTFNDAFDKEDLRIDGKAFKDDRIGWRDCRYVCTVRYGHTKYTHPQCIGMYATDYSKQGE